MYIDELLHHTALRGYKYLSISLPRSTETDRFANVFDRLKPILTRDIIR